jgi:hypothetical protein
VEIIWPALCYLAFGICVVVVVIKHSYQAKHGRLPYDYQPGHQPINVRLETGEWVWIDPVTRLRVYGYSPFRDKGDVVERRNRALMWTAAAVGFHEAVKHIPQSSPEALNDDWNHPWDFSQSQDQ